MRKKGLYMKYFVLAPSKVGPYGAASRRALSAYSEAIEQQDPELARSLEEWVRRAEAEVTSDVVHQSIEMTSSDHLWRVLNEILRGCVWTSDERGGFYVEASGRKRIEQILSDAEQAHSAWVADREDYSQ